MQAVDQKILEFTSNVDEMEVLSLQEKYDAETDPADLNYDDYALAFVSEYFWRNFWKVYMMLSEEDGEPETKIQDFGAGSGGATVAYIAWVLFEENRRPDEFEVTLVDISSEQLRIAEQIIEAGINAVERTDVDIETRNMDIAKQDMEPDSSAVTLLSYIISENLKQTQPLLEESINSTTEAGTIYVVDRRMDDVWHAIDDAMSMKPLATSGGEVELPKERYLTDKQITDYDITARYLAIDVPHPKSLYYLAERYFEVWKHQQTQHLKDIFSENAIYIERAFEEPQIGIDEIEAYWREKVEPQQNIVIDTQAVAYNQDNTFIEWTASFSTDEKKETNLHGVMILEYDRSSETITQLREYFDVKQNT